MQVKKDESNIPPEFRGAIPVWNSEVDQIIKERAANDPSILDDKPHVKQTLEYARQTNPFSDSHVTASVEALIVEFNREYEEPMKEGRQPKHPAINAKTMVMAINLRLLDVIALCAVFPDVKEAFNRQDYLHYLQGLLDSISKYLSHDMNK